MLKWFSIEGIKNEIKRIRWPSRQELFSDTSKVLVFSCFFGVFFVVCELLITFFLKLIGIGV